ncbi:unnamed protein product [Cylicocyclus nassatus]|uniref:Uncharacterized protein n=1 Tax=Cylicocyclus nassatus TaxID=53992 RepID=A0AA36M4N2_CYLNA|nr:unnamed protein product [Cylicocyclus nassatus]
MPMDEIDVALHIEPAGGCGKRNAVARGAGAGSNQRQGGRHHPINARAVAAAAVPTRVPSPQPNVNVASPPTNSSVAPLPKNFFAVQSIVVYPAWLIELPNLVAYQGTLVSGVRAEDHRMLFSVMRFPSPEVPFTSTDVPACSTRTRNKFPSNVIESQVCWNLVSRMLERGIPVGQ